MTLDELRSIPLLDGLTDDQLVELRRRRRRGVVRARRRAVPQRSGRGFLVASPRGQDRAGQARRPRGHRARHDDHARPVGRRVPGVGPQRRLHGDRPGRSRDGRVLRVPAERLAARAQAWFPFGVHLIKGLMQTVRNIEATARQREALVALGHPGGRARARDQQPGLGRDPGGRRSPGHVQRLDVLAPAARGVGPHRRSVRRARCASAGAPAARPGRGPVGPGRPRGRALGLARRPRRRRGLAPRTGARHGRCRRRLVRPARRAPRCAAPGTRPALDGELAVDARRCWRRSRSRPSGCRRWSRRSGPTRSSTGRRCSAPTSPRGSRAR